MRNRSKLLLAGLTAALMLATAVSSASANRLSISGDQFRAIWARLTFTTSATSTTCPVTLLGSFHRRTITKATPQLIGHINSVTVADASCEGGRATALAETLPWNLSFTGFNGRLPTPSGYNLQLINAAWIIVSAGIDCLARADTTEPAGGIAQTNTNGQITSLQASETFEIDLDDPGFFCAIAGDSAFVGTGTMSDIAPGTFEFTPGGEIALDSLHAVTFAGGERSMTCNWVLSGSMTRGSITRVEGATVGSITAAAVDRCGGGSVERVLSTPWSIKYVSAAGTVPGSVTAVTLKVEGFSVNLKSFGSLAGCLYRGDLTGTLELSGANAYPTGLWRLSEPRLAKISGPGGCPSSITVTGTYWLGPEQELRFVEGSGSLVFIRLI